MVQANPIGFNKTDNNTNDDKNNTNNTDPVNPDQPVDPNNNTPSTDPSGDPTYTLLRSIDNLTHKL